MFALNPVFYFSRGVSTKLGKALALGIPVITTQKGMRGYQWKKGEILTCDQPAEMADLILKYAFDESACTYFREQVRLIKKTSPHHEQLMDEVISLLE